MSDYQRIDSFTLIRDALRHIALELKRKNPDLFRITKEAYNALYRTMTEALLIGNPDRVTYSVLSKRNKKKTRKYRSGNEPWKVITKQKIEGCQILWKYTDPVDCDKPNLEYENRDSGIRKLLPFDDMIAMIQTECCMGIYIHSKPIQISDDGMKSLDWMYTKVRNEFEHFTPKGYSVHKDLLIRAIIISLKVTRDLIHESGTIFPFGYRPPRKTFNCIIERINDMGKQCFPIDSPSRKTQEEKLLEDTLRSLNNLDEGQSAGNET